MNLKSIMNVCFICNRDKREILSKLDAAKKKSTQREIVLSLKRASVHAFFKNLMQK